MHLLVPSSLGFSGYNEMLGLGKPFAFAEIGPKSTTKTFDYSLWATAIKQNYPETVYFLAWSGSYSPANNVNSSGLMNDVWVVNRGEVDLSSVTEAVYINDDFNSQTVGSVPEGWTISAPASTSVSIQDIPNTSDKSAVLSDSTVTASVYMKKGFTARSRNTTVEFTFKTDCGSSLSSFYVSKAANPAANLGLDASGNLIYRTSSGSTVVQAVSPDTWYSVNLLVKPSIRKYDIYIDGTLKASNVPFYANVNWLDNVRFETGVSSTEDLYLSNVNVNPSN